MGATCRERRLGTAQQPRLQPRPRSATPPPVQAHVRAVEGTAGGSAGGPHQCLRGGIAEVLPHWAQLDGVQRDGGWGRRSALVPPQRHLRVSRGVPVPLSRLLVPLSGQPPRHALLQAAAAAAALTAQLGPTGLAAVGRAGGEALVGVVQGEGLLTAADSVRVC